MFPPKRFIISNTLAPFVYWTSFWPLRTFPVVLTLNSSVSADPGLSGQRAPSDPETRVFTGSSSVKST